MQPAVLHPAPRSHPSACSPAASRLLRPSFAAPRLSLPSAVLPCGYTAPLLVSQLRPTREPVVHALVSGLRRRCSWLLVLDRVAGSSRTSVFVVPVVYAAEYDLCAKGSEMARLDNAERTCAVFPCAVDAVTTPREYLLRRCAQDSSGIDRP